MPHFIQWSLCIYPPKFSLHSDPESHWPFFSLLLQCQREIHPQHSQKFPPRAILLQMVFLLLPRSKKKQHNNTLVACFPATSRGVSWMGDLTRFLMARTLRVFASWVLKPQKLQRWQFKTWISRSAQHKPGWTEEDRYVMTCSWVAI